MYLALQPINIRGKKYSFTNTCPFDSLLQIMLVAAADFPQVAKVFKSLQDKISIFKLVINILRRGLNTAAYTKRGVILIDIVSQLFPNNMNYKCANNYEVECSMNVKILTENLMPHLPTFEVTSECSEGCPPHIRKNRFLLLNHVDLFAKNLKEELFPALKNQLKCSNAGCVGFLTRKYTSSGKY